MMAVGLRTNLYNVSPELGCHPGEASHNFRVLQEIPALPDLWRLQTNSRISHFLVLKYRWGCVACMRETSTRFDSSPLTEWLCNGDNPYAVNHGCVAFPLSLYNRSLNILHSPGVGQSRPKRSGFSPVQCGVIIDCNRISLAIHQTSSDLI